MTLFRAVGVISRGPMATRALPAGPSTPTPAAQMYGPFRADLAVHAGTRNPYEIAEDAFTPLLVAHLPAARWGDRGQAASALTVDGAEISALTRRDDGALEVRAFNPTDDTVTLTIAGRTGRHTDLRGAATGATFDGSTPLLPHQVVTIELDETQAETP